MNKVVNIIVTALACIVILAGCSGNSNKSTSNQSDKDTMKIKHAMGTTEIKGQPKRVVTLYQGATDVAVSLGVKPVGAVESWTQKPKYNYLKKALKDTTIVGQEPTPNLEEISKLKPDLIVASKVRNEKVYDQLSKIAPTISTDNVFKFKDTTKLMGKALGKERKADKLLKKYDDKVAAFKKDAEAKYKDAWPLSASVVNFRADHARIYAGGYAGEILSDLGFKRNKALQKEVDKGKDIIQLTSKESIPLMKADHIFVVQSDPTAKDAGLVKKTEDEWTSSKEWKHLTAVKNNQVSTDLDEITWNLAGGYQSSLKLIDDLYDKLNIDKQSK
ncbi:ABC transporter substrate-binding protein [Staphylococcus lugdunensis]|uniref:ABC transporter substrate-binding protein n=1 Tax=Staphylococcus lugdunensis TaxID=28035 RepID=UPI000A11F6DC|nr:iron-siderophore ABC transporter substrate-binding protein [Staphylococcus lugdunensis]ARJ26194.1 iron ABC transporter substrate-binding protein [Staphylococcus lugdunensis]MCH8673575.1 iron-siderophore ABC transporter substrate-binding protein [Staphylococcus lugdunensis]MCH8675331.1 iron-siderophore ABC transporter substrate-binding protein [Staphylococcus lugdunensis]MCI2752507.1 iron-siderophore ABC transporter substrate-binding protein [Staphylococcus lugdunensis]MCI2762457.1 iron-side